jgi:hypothetical protein
MTRAAPDVLRACTAVQLARLDGRGGDITVILAGLTAPQLRAIIAEMAVIWAEAITWTGHLPGMREAVAADALRQAVMPEGKRP